MKREGAPQFLCVCLWDSADLIDSLLALYDKLDENLKNEIPL